MIESEESTEIRRIIND